MKSARYTLLIQKQFDVNLSEREKYELDGFLAGNEAAAKLVQSLTKVIEECSQIPLDDAFRHPHPEQLLQAILIELPPKQSQSWFSIITKLIADKKQPAAPKQNDDLVRLRKDKRQTNSGTEHPVVEQPARAGDPSASLQAARERVQKKINPVREPGDAVSLAEAIKQRVARGAERDESQDQLSGGEPIMNTGVDSPIYRSDSNNRETGQILQYQSGNRGISKPVDYQTDGDWEAPPKSGAWTPDPVIGARSLQFPSPESVPTERHQNMSGEHSFQTATEIGVQQSLPVHSTDILKGEPATPRGWRASVSPQQADALSDIQAQVNWPNNHDFSMGGGNPDGANTRETDWQTSQGGYSAPTKGASPAPSSTDVSLASTSAVPSASPNTDLSSSSCSADVPSASSSTDLSSSSCSADVPSASSSTDHNEQSLSPFAGDWQSSRTSQDWDFSAEAADLNSGAASTEEVEQHQSVQPVEPQEGEWETIEIFNAEMYQDNTSAKPNKPGADLPVAQPSAIESEGMEANQPSLPMQMIKASGSIPVDDILAHINSIFDEKPLARPSSAGGNPPALHVVQQDPGAAAGDQLSSSNVVLRPSDGTMSGGTASSLSAQPEQTAHNSIIPVNEIISHMNKMFMEPEPARQTPSKPDAPVQGHPESQSAVDQSLSGNWPQFKNSNSEQRQSSFDQSKLARLNPKTDMHGRKHDNAPVPNGRISSFAPFIIDKDNERAIGAIANALVNLPTARVLSQAESDALRECLKPIQEQDGVAGCLIIGYDGMVITSTLPSHADGDSFSAWALLTYIHSQDIIHQLGHQLMRQFVSRTTSGYLLLADFGQGLLLAVSENASTEAMLPLLRSVRRVTAA